MSSDVATCSDLAVPPMSREIARSLIGKPDEADSDDDDDDDEDEADEGDGVGAAPGDEVEDDVATVALGDDSSATDGASDADTAAIDDATTLISAGDDDIAADGADDANEDAADDAAALDCADDDGKSRRRWRRTKRVSPGEINVNCVGSTSRTRASLIPVDV